MRLSIRYQLLLPLVALMAGVVGMSVWSALSSAGRARRQIETQMDAVAQTVRSATFPRNVQTLNLMKGLSGAEFVLCDAHRRPLRDKEGQPLTTLPSLPATLPALSNASVHPLGELVEVDGKSYFCRGVPLGSEVGANLTVFLLYAEALWRDALWQSVWPALFLGVLGGAVSIVLTIAVTQRLTRRIQELERRTRLIADGDFSPMPLPKRQDELRDLAGSVNDMAQKLAQYRETMSRTERLRLLGQVSGGLAHQLRNGVTGAKLAVQLHAKENSDDANGESLNVALRQLTLIEMHLKRFLDLGKAVQLQKQPCDLQFVLREALALLGPQAKHAGIELRRKSNPEQPIQVLADAGQLGHVFVNLLGNALEAAGQGGTVEVEAGTENGTAFVEVIDSGPGPLPEVAGRLFEPFVTTKPEGVGLGLAVARQVAEAHGGALRWFRSNGATCFRFELPVG
ncbi:MAG: HAMP domain-containing histidine kinase [Gemmataceae bacterium]|nr:HAMP domain-containing histidine kinase [Gemmataceae bacterium]MCI0742931.1 HAMP domain-containing histidine kinase [Gemmataceae bacterium]